jgi:fucose permease
VALVTVSGLAGAVGVVVFLFVETALLAYVVLAWIGLCLSGIFPNVMAELNNRDPEKTGTVTAVMAMGAAIGAGVFQWFVGYVAENASLTAAFVTPAVLQLLLVASFWSAARRR